MKRFTATGCDALTVRGGVETACGSVTAPRIRRGPPPRGQTRTWIASTRRRSWAPGPRRGTGAAAARASAGDGFGTIADLQRACAPGT
jgi:hypothetical protein